MKNMPNLFVIGAMKSGTSSLCRYLNDHPSIFISNPKEPMHFSRRENYQKGHASYIDLFDLGDSMEWVGEGSTEYTKRPFFEGVAERIHAFNPRARFIYIMRDPVDRIASQYRHMVMTRRENRTLTEALGGNGDYLSNSYYAYQLDPYVRLFGRNSIHVDTFERLQLAPLAVCSEIFRYLGVDEKIVPSSIGMVVNESPAAVVRANMNVFPRLLRKVARPLKHCFSEKQREWIRRIMFETEIELKGESFSGQVEIVRRDLAPLMFRWVSELETLLGGSYEIWPTIKIGKAGNELDMDALKKYYLPKELRAN